MSTELKGAVARTMSPEVLYWIRSVKRAVMGQQPLPRPGELSRPSILPETIPEPVHDNRILQDRALELYKANKLAPPAEFFSFDDVLFLPAKEIARALSLSIQYINSSHVNGDVAEFGTMSGFSAGVLATAMVLDLQRQPLGKSASGENPFRKLRLFDSFEGLPEITAEADQSAPHVVSGAWAKGGCKVLGAAELAEKVGRIIPPHRFEIYEGWFADTVKRLPDDTRFAMIHFDGDLYQSTMDTFDELFARGLISTGAMICFDDWNSNRALPTTGERLAWAELTSKYAVEASHVGDYASAGTRFIIHSYRGIPADPE